MYGPLPKRARAPGWLAIAAGAVVASIGGSVALAQPVQPTKDPKALEEAKKHWEAGQAFYNDPSGKHNCEEAVREFGRAYELSGSVKAARARGICEMELEQDGPAIADYEVYLATPPKDAPPDEIALVKSDVKKLQAVVADVTFQTDKPSTRLTTVHTRADGTAITNHYVIAQASLALKIHPGQYTFTAQADGAPDITWQADVQPSSQSTKSIDFAAAIRAAAAGKAPPPPVEKDEGTRPIPIAAWVVGGVTVACLGGTITAGVLGLQAKSTYDKQNGKASAATLTPLRKDVVTKNMVSDIFLGLTVAAAATTTVLIITRPTVHSKGATRTGLVIAPAPLTGEREGAPSLAGAGVFALGAF